MADVDGQDGPLERAGKETQPAGINWMFPLLGAIGFGIGFACICAIGATVYNIIQNIVAYTFPGTEVSPGYGVIRGVSVGVAGGVGLGLAFKNKKRAFSLALTGALGFSVAFVIVLAADIDRVADFAANLFQSSGGSIELFLLSLRVWRGLVAGSVVGAIGGSALGLGLPQPNMKPALWLGGAGGLWFAIAFAFESVFFNGDVCTSWNGWGGALGGAVLGYTLALYNKIQGATSRRQN